MGLETWRGLLNVGPGLEIQAQGGLCSLLLGLTLALLDALFLQMHFHRTPGGRTIRMLTAPASPAMWRALACAGSAYAGPLRWGPVNKARYRHAVGCACIPRASFVASLLACLSLPMPVGAMDFPPPGANMFLGDAALHLASTEELPQAFPAARPVAQRDPAPPDYHDLVLEWPSRHSAPGHNTRELLGHDVFRIAWPPVHEPPATPAAWLGVAVYAPHRQVTHWAFHVPDPAMGPDDFMVRVLDLGPALYDGAYDSIVPVYPQRHDGYAMVLVFHSVLAHLEPVGLVPVIIDLSRVGGHYFATTLPVGTSYAAFEAYILPLLGADVDELSIYVGGAREPSQPHADLPLQAGHVITVLSPHMNLMAAPVFEDLFLPGATWGAFEQIPLNVTTPAYCVTYCGARYLLHRGCHPGDTVREAVCALLAQEPDQVVMAVATTMTDLDVQGTACQAIIMVEPLPYQSTMVPPQYRRRDVFVLHDLRVLGVRPLPLHTHALECHVPSVLARAHLYLPDCYEVQIAGGRLAWPDVRVTGSAVLVYGAICHALEASLASTAGDDDDNDSEGPGDDDDTDTSLPPPSDGGTTTVPATSDSGLPDVDDRNDRSRSPSCVRKLVCDLGLGPSCHIHTSESFSAQTLGVHDTLPFHTGIWDSGCLPQAILGKARQYRGPDSARVLRFLRTQATADTTGEALWAQLGGRGPFQLPPPILVRIPPQLGGVQLPQMPFMELTFLVSTPDYVPDVVRIELLFPSTVATALREVSLNRPPERGALLPALVLVHPQPARAYATVLALPPWALASEHVVVYFDCSRYDGTGYSVLVAPLLRREDILVIAGLGIDAQVLVFIGDSPWALPSQQAFQLQHGDLITITWLGIDMGVGVSLHAMLQTTLGWEPHPVLPGQQSQGFWLLTDAFPERFNADARRRLLLRQDIAVQLGYELRSITLRATEPRVLDYMDQGWPASAVLVATQQIARPTRRPPACYVLVLDMRPILQGLDWQLVPTSRVRWVALIAQLRGGCPPGHAVAIHGPPLQHDELGAYIEIVDGQVLVVEYAAVDAWDAESAATGDDGLDLDGAASEAGSMSGSDTDMVDAPDVLPRAAEATQAPPAQPHGLQRGSIVLDIGFHMHPLQRSFLHICLLASFFLPVPAVPLEANTLSTTIRATSTASRVAKWQGFSEHPAHSTEQPPLTSVLLAGQQLAVQLKGRRRRQCGANADALIPSSTVAQGLASIPTPCRSLHAQASLQAALDAWPSGPTLLEASLVADSTPMFEARALLETLVEHFRDGQSVPHPSVPLAGAPKVPLQLNQRVPATPYQQAALALTDIVPRDPLHAARDALEPDWLDNDLRHLLRCPSVPDHWKQRFATMPLWHQQPTDLQPDGILVFTDGSASCTQADLAPASWAFAVWILHGGLQYFLGGSTHVTAQPASLYHIGESDDTALTGELLALSWATIWAIENGASYCRDIEFRYDATSAGGGVFGDCRCPSSAAGPHGPGLGAFARQLRQTLETRCRVRHSHVKGHSGCLGNELCDQLSKFSRRSVPADSERLLPLWPHRWWQHALWQWGWMAHVSGADLPSLPALEAEAVRLQTCAHDPQPPTLGVVAGVSREAEVTYDFTVVTYNVLTLFDPKAPQGRAARRHNVGLLISGKRDVLKRQLVGAAVWLVGMQETRLPDSATLADRDFWMLSAEATAAGHGGCALWINKHHVYAREAGREHRIQEEHITVTSFSPRHLQVQLVAPRLNLTVLVLHAPRAVGSALDEVRAFWQARRQDLQCRPAASDFILLCDANSHLGSVETLPVGPHGSELETPAGAEFAAFLQEVQGYLPSTFSDLHEGEHWTWCGPGADPVRHRLDFVVLPQGWRNLSQTSWIWYDFEALQARQDHMPACVHVTFRKASAPHAYTTAKRRAIRPARELSKEARATFVTTLERGGACPWWEDVDTHYLRWVRQVATAATEVCEPPVVQPTNEYLTPATLALVWERRDYRRYIRAEERELERRLQMIAFGAFILHLQHGTFTPAAHRSIGEWLQAIDISIARALERFYELTHAIKAAVRRDRVAYLSSLAQAVTLQDLRRPKDLFAAVRRAFPGAAAARRQKFRPLPAVRLASGELAKTPLEKTRRWTEFFQEQEGGCQVPAGAYKEAYAHPTIPVLPAGPVFSIAALPTLGELEQQLLSAKLGKACGPDALTAEVFRVAPARLARFAFPLHLKVALGAREPTEWRGGFLMCLAKKAANALHCSSFRSILLANVIAKTHHRLLRDKLTPAFKEYKLELQSGQLPGTGVDSLILLVRTYQLRAQHHGMCFSMTYYDVQSAFYRVVREALLPTASDAESGERFLALLHNLAVPPEALRELVQHLQSMAVMAEARVSLHLQAQTADLFRGTWFRLDAGGPLVATFKGTRPGDPLADLLFAFSFAAYLRSSEQALRKAGVATCQPDPALHGDSPDSVGCVAWADDYAHLQMHRAPGRLLDMATTAASILVTHATSVGMALTFAPDKTAILLSAKCPRTLSSQIHHDEAGHPGLWIRDEIADSQHFLRIVDSYKHLGSITVANATAGPEIQYRFAQAQTMLRPLRSKLFSAEAIPLPLRRTLLRSLVISRFVFSSATLVLHAGQHRRRWSQLYVQLWRSLSRRPRKDKQPHSYDVLRRAAAPSPLLALAHARAVMLKRILFHGPETLRTLLLAHCARRRSSPGWGSSWGTSEQLQCMLKAPNDSCTIPTLFRRCGRLRRSGLVGGCNRCPARLPLFLVNCRSGRKDVPRLRCRQFPSSHMRWPCLSPVLIAGRAFGFVSI